MILENKTIKKFSILSAVAYYLSIPFIYMISLLTFRLLYVFSNFIAFVLFKIVGYRKRVVTENLKKSFPEKTEKELNTICKLFYHNFCDFILETIKAITISEKELLRRCELHQSAHLLFTNFAHERRSIIIVMGHLGNWEWACNSFNTVSQYQLYVLYHPLSNRYFDDLMYRIRARTGTKLIAMKDTYKKMASNKHDLSATVFVADQTPKPGKAFWTNFLNQYTPVYKGMELIARKMNLPVVYASLKKVARGYY